MRPHWRRGARRAAGGPGGQRADPRAGLRQRSGDGGFDRAPPLRIDPGASGREPQHGPPPISWSGDAHQHALGDQPLQHAGEGAWMHMEDRGEIAGGDARGQPDDPQDQSLWASHAQIRCHALRAAFEAVDDCPQQLHEVEHVGESQRRTRRDGGAVVLCHVLGGVRPRPAWHHSRHSTSRAAA